MLMLPCHAAAEMIAYALLEPLIASIRQVATPMLMPPD